MKRNLTKQCDKASCVVDTEDDIPSTGERITGLSKKNDDDWWTSECDSGLCAIKKQKQTNKQKKSKQTKPESLSWETDDPHYGDFMLVVNMTIDSEETHLWAHVEKIS